MIEPGIYPNLSIEDYHNDKSSMSRSSIKDFHRNPYYYWSMHLNPDRPQQKPMDAMIFGQAFHIYALEQDKFDKLYAIEPSKIFLKDVGREAYDEYKNNCEIISKSGKIILSMEDLIILKNMSNALFKYDRVKEMLKNADIETSFIWEDEESGLRVKARPDILQSNMIIDLKTIADASFYSYQRSMVDGWYHVQGAMIRDGLRRLKNKEISSVINICIEKKYPYCVGIYMIDEAALDYGEELYKKTLLDMKSCIIRNEFSDYSIQTIGLPKWAT